MTFADSRNRHLNMMIAIVLVMFTYIGHYYGWPTQLIRFCQFGSLCFLLLAFFAHPQGRLYEYRYPNKMLFELLLALSVLMMLRGIINTDLGYDSFFNLLGNPKVFMVYFFPFLLGCSALTFDYNNFYRVCTIWTFVFVLIVITNLPELITQSLIRASDPTHNDESVLDVSGIVALSSVPLVIFLQRDIIPKRIWNISVVNLVFLLFVSLLNARRSSTFGVLLVLLYACLKGKRWRWIGVVGALLIAYSMYEFGLLDFMLVRGFEDTRSGVVDHFYADMDLKSWLFGRGATGTYFDPIFVNESNHGFRTEIETGYLDLILKGGIVYLVTYICCLGYAAYLGLRRSKNALCNSFGAIILISLIELIPYGIPTWNLKFFSIWMGVAICLNPTLRAMSNKEVKLFLRLRFDIRIKLFQKLIGR